LIVVFWTFASFSFAGLDLVLCTFVFDFSFLSFSGLDLVIFGSVHFRIFRFFLRFISFDHLPFLSPLFGFPIIVSQRESESSGGKRQGNETRKEESCKMSEKSSQMREPQKRTKVCRPDPVTESGRTIKSRRKTQAQI
jgi:hypothetical protein